MKICEACEQSTLTHVCFCYLGVIGTEGVPVTCASNRTLSLSMEDLSRLDMRRQT